MGETAHSILIVEDDRELNQLLVELLQAEGYRVGSAEDGVTAMRAFQELSPQLVLLDIQMPRMDGFETCRRIRELSDVPIIILSNRQDELDKVRALDLGADDYVTKPFSAKELLARVRAALRRHGPAPAAGSTVRVDDRLSVDHDAAEAAGEGGAQPVAGRQPAGPVAPTRRPTRRLSARLLRAQWAEKLGRPLGMLKRAARFAAGLEPVVVALAAPPLLFPTLRPTWTVVALAALPVVWLARWIGTGRPGAPSPLDGAILLFFLMVPIGFWASPFPALSLPKACGLLLGLAAFRAMVNAVQSPRRLRSASALFLALGYALVVVGLLGASWTAKWPALAPLLERIPRLVEGLPGAEKGIHPNELAGSLLLFLPLSLAMLSARGLARGLAGAVLRLALLTGTLALAVAVLLSQSRCAWAGALAGVGAAAWLRWPRARWLMAVVLVAAALVLLYIGPLEAAQSVFAPSDRSAANWMADSIALEDRPELWSRALVTIQRFPLTGCGLGAFRQVVNALYPLPGLAQGVDVAHAHNVFLQVALDLGLPGLVIYLSLVGIALWIGWRVARAQGARSAPAGLAEAGFGWLGAGIVGSLVAFHVYGLADTVALGAKPGLAFWLLLGLAAALWSVAWPGASPVTEGR